MYPRRRLLLDPAPVYPRHRLLLDPAAAPLASCVGVNGFEKNGGRGWISDAHAARDRSREELAQARRELAQHQQRARQAEEASVAEAQQLLAQIQGKSTKAFNWIPNAHAARAFHKGRPARRCPFAMWPRLVRRCSGWRFGVLGQQGTHLKLVSSRRA